MSQTLRVGDEEGQISAFVAVIVVCLVAVVGLVADGAGVLAARQQAASEAFQAARAGAQALDQADLRSTGEVTLDPSAAQGAAQSYLATAGATGSVGVAGASVTVTVDASYRPLVLGAFGVGPVGISESATVQAVQGIQGAGT